MHGVLVRCCISDFQVSADSTKLVLSSDEICLHCFMKNLFKKQSAKFVKNPSSFTKVMAKHILVCFMPYSVYCISMLSILKYVAFSLLAFAWGTVSFLQCSDTVPSFDP